MNSRLKDDLRMKFGVSCGKMMQKRERLHHLHYMTDITHMAHKQ